MAESRGSGSNVELNDTWSNQTSSPMYSSSPKKWRGRDKIKRTGNVPKISQWGNCCKSMVESRGSDSNVESNDTRINQTSSPMEN
jgi:hypothetical protein